MLPITVFLLTALLGLSSGTPLPKGQEASPTVDGNPEKPPTVEKPSTEVYSNDPLTWIGGIDQNKPYPCEKLKSRAYSYCDELAARTGWTSDFVCIEKIVNEEGMCKLVQK